MSKSNKSSNGKGGAAKASPSTASQGGAKVEKKQVAASATVKKTIDNSIDAKAKRIFAVHPNANELHFTSDNTPFFSLVDAKSHASELENKEIKTLNR